MSSEQRWSEVDDYIGEMLLGRDDALEAALRASAEAGLPAIAVSPPQGKLLHLLARIHGARRILELGTLGGYSTIWLARALPADGALVTLELGRALREGRRGERRPRRTRRRASRSASGPRSKRSRDWRARTPSRST